MNIINKRIINEFIRLITFIQMQLDEALLNKNNNEIIKHTFRLKQIKTVLLVLKRFDEEITKENLISKVSTLSGIGKGSIKRIEEILNFGKLSEISNFENKKGKKIYILKELQKVVGIGKSIAIDLIEKFNIKSVKDLINKHKEGHIELSRSILLGLKYYKVYKTDIPRNEIDKIYKFLKEVISKINKKFDFNDKNKLCIQITGSYRRNKPYSNDIDILLTKYGTKIDNKKKNAMYIKLLIDILKKPLKTNNNKPLLIDDMTNKNVSFKYMGFCKFLNYPIRRMDIIFVSFESYYTALLYFTGSKELNLQMRKKARNLGLKLNENELFDTKNKKRIKIKSENDIFKHIGMEYLNPEFR